MIFFHLWNIQLYLSLKNKLPSQSPVKCPICFTPLDPESISLKWISLKKFLSVRERTFSVLRVKLSISLRGSLADWRIVLLSKSLLTISKHLLVRISSGTPFYFTNVLPKFAVAQWNWQGKISNQCVGYLVGNTLQGKSGVKPTGKRIVLPFGYNKL